ncbi:MAG: hypothetical protein ACQEW9_17090 [Bacteroidota bacterium]|uniref:ATP synthase I chain n=1 Tax=Algoriphagus faecimaris TaxID=686796 RepID=A0A1G6R1U1_9BACT|nr:hypothetical protein [Algoriphagus faecimaris]SDC98005.1 hypothetical protein SAMN04488104_101121 [Algoriphagus faecimaris]
MKLLRNFHLSFLLLSLLIVLLILLLQQVLPQVIHQDIWVIFGFLMFLSYFITSVAVWLYKKSPENILQIKLLGMVIRIISALGFIGILVFLGTENIILFIGDFFMIFLFYLIFDIYTFISNLRPISK